MIPGVDLCLLMLELPLEILKGNQIVQRMDVAGDRLRDGPYLGAADGIWRQQRRLRMCLIEVFDDRHRLSQHLAAGQHQRRHSGLRIDGSILGRVLPSAVFRQMDRDHLIGYPFEIERDANAIGGGRAEIGVEFHETSSDLHRPI